MQGTDRPLEPPCLDSELDQLRQKIAAEPVPENLRSLAVRLQIALDERRTAAEDHLE